jgi:mono/diheme cytochrome c family protein
MKSIACLALSCLLAAACGDDDDDTGAVDSGPGGDIDAAPGIDAGDGVDGGSAAVERGQYLVNVVAACIDCHTPRNEDGSPDMTRFLGGNPTFMDVAPANNQMGLLPTPNLTPDATGLADWSDDDIKNAFLNGMEPKGEALFPVMPYYVFHNMSADDADAIVAYLRSIDPVDQEIPEKQPPFDIEEPAAPFPVEAIPNTTLATDDPNYEQAQQGRYLAGFVGVCMECHTQRTDEDDPSSLDQTQLFAGDEPFEVGKPFGTVYSANITPDPDTGIGDWDVDDVRIALKEGVEPEGEALCPPMPAGPDGPFGGFTDEDAEAIGRFLLTMSPIENEPTAECKLPGVR